MERLLWENTKWEQEVITCWIERHSSPRQWPQKVTSIYTRTRLATRPSQKTPMKYICDSFVFIDHAVRARAYMGRRPLKSVYVCEREKEVRECVRSWRGSGGEYCERDRLATYESGESPSWRSLTQRPSTNVETNTTKSRRLLPSTCGMKEPEALKVRPTKYTTIPT